ncbi:MAG TPA: TetR/AcrR family transcriptional regulator [Thermoleophilaceae bacterium]|jgi:AcrR family transcriptional regulator|nr:TetR/AcrR family transcriptional regulator [Thermoleophilaceae bacterium]
MPRRSNEQAAKTRAAIIDRAVQTASIEGLEGVTIGRLADDLGMSKAGVIGHFGDKVTLQRATFHRAQKIFTAEVWERAEDKPRGLPRLSAVCEAWIKHITHSPFPGGCFMCTVATEWDAREGDIHDEVKDSWRLWLRVLAREAEIARASGDLPADTDPDQVAFELNAIAMALNQSLQLFEDRRGPARARRAVRRVLSQA